MIASEPELSGTPSHPGTPAVAPKARYVMLGGFLGAGKTTAVAALAQHLHGQGLRVGLITNDQGSELVDTAMLRAKGFPSEEIAGGCFCCRFNSLVEAADRLEENARPDVFIAEPVGSCTDLVATVSYPLRRMYHDHFTIAPFSVLVDPVRAEAIFGLRPGKQFSEKVLYIYKKQLEEADFIVISKRETVSPERLEALTAKLRAEFPHAEVMAVSVRTGEGVAECFARIEQGQAGERQAMEVDYDVYAEGEALLGWLNATMSLHSTEPFDANATLERLARDLQERLDHAEIAHLKMTFSPEAGLGDIAVINLVRSDFVPELSLRLEQPATGGQLILNLRAEADPALLERVVRDAVAVRSEPKPDGKGIVARLEHLEAFRPGRPTPTHRFSQPQ